MNKRSRRKMLVAMVIFGVAIASVLLLNAFEENINAFYSPTQIHAGEAPADRTIRVWSSTAVSGARKTASPCSST